MTSFQELPPELQEHIIGYRPELDKNILKPIN